MRLITALTAASAAGSVAFAAPQYTITDLGVLVPGDFASQGQGISAGGVAFGRSVGGIGQAFTHTPATGTVGLPNDPSRGFAVANGANDTGLVVGTGSTTFFGAGAVPLLWQNGTVTQLAIIPGQGVGRANDVNDAGIVVGSNGGGISERATFWSNGTVSEITATTAGGAFMTTAFRINNANQVVGVGIDPALQSRNVALLYDIDTDTMVEIPALAGDNGGIAFDISESGFVVGSSSFNQSGSVPFVWSVATGTMEVGLPTGASQGSARGVNSDGWVVGTASSAFALPFLFDGDATYLLQDLIDPSSGWDLSMNTNSAALGIAEDGTIVGTGVLNGDIRAFRMTLVPAPGVASVFGVAALFARRRR